MSLRTYSGAVQPEIMALLASFSHRLMAGRPYDQLIDREGDPYIERWFLARKNAIPASNADPAGLNELLATPSEIENIYLHRYVRADVEEPHCHPWSSASLIVEGGYTEDVYEAGVHIGSHRRVPGDIVLRPAHEVHAITDCQPGTLSMFATLRKERDWGFHTAEGFVPWQNFRAWKNAQQVAV